MVTEQAIRDLAAKIAAEFRPERIILFGSRASGNAREDSDVDLLVVIPYDGPAYLKAAEIIIKTHPGTFAIDLLVRSPEEMASRYAGGDPLIRDAVDYGVVLFEAAV